MKIFETNFNTEWVYSTQEKEFDGVSFAEYLKEKGWDNIDIATEMADRFIYRCLLNNNSYYAPKISGYDLEDTEIEWDDNVLGSIRRAFSNFVWQLFVDDEDDYDHKEVDYQEEIDGLTISLYINESYDHSINFSIETK
jgi:hypothetical protein